MKKLKTSMKALKKNRKEFGFRYLCENLIKRGSADIKCIFILNPGFVE